MAQSVARLIKEPEVPGQYLVWPHTFVSLSTGSRRAVCELLAKVCKSSTG